MTEDLLSMGLFSVRRAVLVDTTRVDPAMLVAVLDRLTHRQVEWHI